jgi:flagellar biogenesis protein FliO
MRVAESIPLGEKRFVALLTVDGREFLIGGGSSGVSLLSQWNSSTESPASGKQKFGSRESLE